MGMQPDIVNTLTMAKAMEDFQRDIAELTRQLQNYPVAKVTLDEQLAAIHKNNMEMRARIAQQNLKILTMRDRLSARVRSARRRVSK